MFALSKLDKTKSVLSLSDNTKSDGFLFFSSRFGGDNRSTTALCRLRGFRLTVGNIIHSDKVTFPPAWIELKVEILPPLFPRPPGLKYHYLIHRCRSA